MKAKRIKIGLIIAIMITIISIIIIAWVRKSTMDNLSDKDLFGKIVVWSEKDNLNSLKSSGDRFKKLYPRVQIEYLNVDKDKLYNKMISGFGSDSGIPDVFSISDDSIEMLVNKFPDGFLDISSTVNPIKNKYLNNKIYQCSINENIFAIPWDTAPVAVFYRKDILKNSNILPEDIKTWNDYIKAGKIILANTNGITKMLPVDEKNDDILFREMLNQLNTGYFDEAGKVILNSEESIKAMEMIKKMNEESLIYNVDGIDALKASIKNGSIATLPYSNSFAKIISENAPDQLGKWGIMKLPVFEPGGGDIANVDSSSIMITKASKNKKVALEFAEFVTSDNNSLLDNFNKYGKLPAYIPFYDNMNFDNGVTFFDNEKIWSLFSNIAKDSNEIKFTEKFPETKSQVIKAQADILNNHLNVQATMDALQAGLDNSGIKY